ncbi:MAG TPA: pitrilysin family protein [Sandaracinaceae bacterium LLY-WYZ-13_1]|nr:pitrilysin family protein [Sandaracinaceae bacterium LLY-WYZ-13_1]
MVRFGALALILAAGSAAGGRAQRAAPGATETSETAETSEIAPDEPSPSESGDAPGEDGPLVVELPEPRDPDAPIAPPPEVYTLDNGLRVVLQPVSGRRFTAVAMTYRVGSRDVPHGWRGLAHLTEHLMFSGTDTLNEVEIYLRLEAAGAVERNGETGPDRTIFYEVVPSSQIPTALYLESHRLARMLAGLTEGRVARQRAVVLHEGWERGGYGWRGLLAEQLYAGTLGDDHPYRSIVERSDDVAAARLEHVQWFFQRHYAPDRATLVLVGGFDPARVRPLVERHLGPVRRSAPPVERASAPPPEPLATERRIEVEIQHDRDQLYLAWPTPALYAPGDAELDVISTLLTERRDAPIRRALVESGLALEVGVRQRSHELGSVFAIHAVPSPGHDVAELRAAVDRELARLRRAPFDAATVRRAREVWARRMRLGVEDLASRAVRLGVGDDEYLPTLENERRRYLAVDASDVARTLRRWLPTDRRLVLVGVADPRASPRGRVRSDDGG